MALKKKAYDDIKRCIIQCTYRPAQMLNEQMLLSQFAISRTPIRDAISRLEQEGFVTIEGKKGIRVSTIDSDVINQVYDTRILYECYALDKGFENLDRALLEELWEKLQDKNLEREELRALDLRIHSMFISMISNVFIHTSYEILQDWIARISYYSAITEQKRHEQTREEHIQIIKCCMENDKSGTQLALRTHLENARRHSLKSTIRR